MDAVEIGTYAALGGTIVVLIFLSYKVYNLIWKDNDKK